MKRWTKALPVIGALVVALLWVPTAQAQDRGGGWMHGGGSFRPGGHFGGGYAGNHFGGSWGGYRGGPVTPHEGFGRRWESGAPRGGRWFPRMYRYGPAYSYRPYVIDAGPSYYCASADAFYPFVTYCPEGWQLVRR